MLSRLIKNRFIKRFFTNDRLKLGRWETNTNEKNKEIKIYYANIDNCGDIICGNPERKYNEIVEKKDKEKS